MFELIFVGLFLHQDLPTRVYHDRLAEVYCMSDAQTPSEFSPELQRALQRLALRKKITTPKEVLNFYGQEYSICTLNHIRHYYYTAELLPDLKQLELLPSAKTCQDNYGIAGKYVYWVQNSLIPQAAPWNLQLANQILKEAEDLRYIWGLAWDAHVYGNDSIYQRERIQKLQNILNGDLTNLHSYPIVPHWRLDRTN